MKNYSSKLNLFLVFVVLFLVVVGCENPGAKEERRRRFAQAGRTDGEKAGFSDGYKIAYDSAKDSAYGKRVWEVYNSDQYQRNQTSFVIVLLIGFLLGFGFQYGILYLLRRKEVLLDIDRIILSKNNTRINFNALQGRDSDSDVNS